MSSLYTPFSFGFGGGGSGISATCLEIIATDYLKITFSDYVVVNDSLRSTDSYLITSLGTGIPVLVLGVRISDSDTQRLFAKEIYLNISQFSIGQEYQFTFTDDITSIYGITVDPTAYWIFEARATKVDAILDCLPNVYDKSVDSSIRHVVSAIGILDEAIGGARNDDLQTCPDKYVSADSYYQFIYDPNTDLNTAPEIESVSPNTGIAAGGTAIAITGVRFQSGSIVTVAGIVATSIIVVNSGTILCTTPAHAAGLVDVLVSNPDGTFYLLEDGFTYT